MSEVATRKALMDRERAQYRVAAQKLVSSLAQATVPAHAHVALCEGGAFVECVVWVPADALFQR